MAFPGLASGTGNLPATSTRQALASLGKLFSVTNPTAGTGVVSATLAAWSATANGLFVIQNKNPVGGPNIYLDRLKLIQTATAPTGTAIMRFEIYNEQGIVTGTGNVATRTPVNLNPAFPGSNTQAVVQAFSAGGITIPAAVGVRNMMDIGAITTGVTVINDQFVVDFGTDGPHSAGSPLTAARATDPATLVTTMAAHVIPPGTTSWINMWWLTQAANVPSYEYSLIYGEI